MTGTHTSPPFPLRVHLHTPCHTHTHTPCFDSTGGGPKRLRVLLEGESLLNDASGLTLFEVFFHIVSRLFVVGVG